MEIPEFLKRTEDVPQPSIGVEFIQVVVLHSKSKMLNLTKTKFDDIEKCKSYLKEIISGSEIVSSSKGNTYLTLSCGIHVSMNYSYKKILKLKKPKYKLKQIFFDTRDISSVKNVSWTKTGEKKPQKEKGQDMPVGNLVPIKQVCKDNDIDPRIARGILRSSKDPLVVAHKSKSRWEFTNEDVPHILKVLRKGLKK